MDKATADKIINTALENFEAYEQNSILPLLERDPGIIKRQSSQLLKKMFDPGFRDRVKLEIQGVIHTGDKDANNVANEQIAKVVHGG